MASRRGVGWTVSIGAAELLERARRQGGRLETSGLNGGYVVELLTAGLVDVKSGVMVMTEGLLVADMDGESDDRA